MSLFPDVYKVQGSYLMILCPIDRPDAKMIFFSNKW